MRDAGKPRWLRCVFLCILSVVLLISSICTANADEIRLKNLIEEALQKSPQVLASESRALAAGYRVPQAGSLPDPMIMFGYQNEGWERNTFGKESDAQRMFSASQMFPFLGKLLLKERWQRERIPYAHSLPGEGAGMNLTKHSRYALFAISGAVAGYFVFHPYTMLAHIFADLGHKELHLKDFYEAFSKSLTLEMTFMALAFAVFGAGVGLLIGALSERRRRLFEAEMENEKRKTAIETLRRLMITLSHHLLNANTVIGGTAHRCRRHTTDAGLIESLDLIRDETAKIDVVIRTLKKITEIKTADYTSEGKDLMIDISREIDENLVGHGSILKEK
jgi:hypothetical protein